MILIQNALVLTPSGEAKALDVLVDGGGLEGFRRMVHQSGSAA